MRIADRQLLTLVVAVLSACSSTPEPVALTGGDAGVSLTDTATAVDASSPGVADVARVTIDSAPAGPSDTGSPAEKATAWGPISGACGGVAAEIDKSTPSFLVTTWQFDKTGPFDPKPLRPGAKKRYEGENAGGSSMCSEVMSVQLLHECEGATLYKTETEITYKRKQGAITDWVALVGQRRLGVSVTRAYKGPTIDVYTADDAKTLLEKKLAGINQSSAKVSDADKWLKQVLHVWTLRADWVPILETSWKGLDAQLRADTIVLVTVEKNSKHIVADTCD